MLTKQENDWETRLSALFKFIHQIISLLYHKVEAPETCLRLFLLAAQVADDCRLEELTYEFFVQAFVIYEESISESRAQLQAITGIIGALQTSRVFGNDNYDTLITKAALHGSKLLKKSHQATAVLFASHMWWQGEVPGRDKDDKVSCNHSTWWHELTGRNHTEMTSGYWSVCKSRSESRHRASTSSRRFNSTSMRWTDISTTLSKALKLSLRNTSTRLSS